MKMGGKMKVLLLGCTPPPVGGIAKWTMRMLNAKLPTPWSLEFVDVKMIEREVFGDNIQISYKTEIKRWINIWRKMIAKLKDKEIKVVHTCPIGTVNSMLAVTVNTIISKFYRKKVVLHFRCTLPNMIDSKKKEIILKNLCKKGDLIIALNKQTKDYLSQLTKTRVVIVPNFVDLEEIETVDKKINKKLKYAIYTGGVIEEKGCIDIISLSKRFPDVIFKLIGQASEKVKQEAIGLENVIFTGVLKSSEVKEELRNADVYLFFSKFLGEGFSNALAEAMAMGLPCIVTNWAANADMIEHEKGGFVINIGDIDAAEEALDKLRKYSIRKEQSLYNIHKVYRNYTETSVVQKYIELYESLL